MPKQYNGLIDIQEVRNAVYVTDQGHIDCEINHPEYGWIPYTIAPDDADMTIDNQQLLDIIKANGGAAPLTEEKKYERYALSVRLIRETYLTKYVDPIATNMLRYNALSEAQKADLAEYRQALLDVTEQDGFPYQINWPDPPTI